MLDRIRSRGAPALDIVLATAVYAVSVFPGIQYTPRDSLVRVLILDALTAVPLLWRRRFPLPVLVVVGIGTIGLSMLGELPKLPYGQLVATYSVAAFGPPVIRTVGAVLTAAGVALSLAFDSRPLDAFSFTSLAFVGAYALGVAAQGRQDHIAMLEERSARLAEEHARIAATERERIARDMHDILVHSVSVIVVQAEAGAAVVRTAPDAAERAFDAISATGREALTQLRGTLGVLRGGDGSLEPQPDLDGLPTLVERARGGELDAVLHREGEPRQVPAELAVAAYRVVQEALTNTIKHARASRVDVWLRWSRDALELEVTDNGRPTAAPRDHVGHGLVGMRERVSACGGELTTGPGPRGGFQVVAILPAPAGDDRAGRPARGRLASIGGRLNDV